MKRGYRNGVFVVAYRKDNDKLLYLLLKRHKHWKGWEFCKGGVDKGETIKNCIVREIREETGQNCINVKRYSKTGKYKYNKSFPERPGLVGQTYSLYSCELKREKVKVDKKEHNDYKWVNVGMAIKMLKWPNQKTCIKLVDKRLK